MPPKTLSAEQQALADRLQTTFAVPSAKAADLASNAKQATWATDLAAALPDTTWDEAKGKLLAALVPASSKLAPESRLRLASWIHDGKLDRADKLTAAVKLVEAEPAVADDRLAQGSGVGQPRSDAYSHSPEDLSG
jgi:soluble lytic murein transglycosylase-like protein